MRKIMKGHHLVLIVFLLALLFRFYTISSRAIVFWYDQARDFTLVQEILAGDLKIQGPSASGTNDTVYHGVFYYYFILPWVFLGGGDVILVNYMLAFFSSLAVILVYILSYSLFKNRPAALLASFLLAVSFLNNQLGTWLSNPQTLSLSVPIFYYFFYQIFFKQQQRIIYFASMALSLGMSIQAGFFESYLVVPIILAYLLRAWQLKRFWWWSVWQIICFIAIFLLSISSMLLTEFLLIKRGILDLNNLPLQAQAGANLTIIAAHIYKVYLKQLQLVFSPTWLYLSFLFLLPLYFAWRKINTNLRIFFVLLISAPIWLMLVQQRNSGHLFIGLELLLYLLLGHGLQQMWQQHKLGKIAAALFLLVFITSNLLVMQDWRMRAKHYFYPVQSGAFLSHQLDLLRYTYHKSAGQEFSISTSTNPYAINVTWGYLYKTYGMKKFAYLPNFVGPDQVGLVGRDFLKRVQQPHALHFTILEPDTGLNEKMTEIFMGEQNSHSLLIEEVKFGSLVLQIRQAK